MLNYKYNLKELIELLESRNEVDAFIVDIFKFNLICDENYGVEEMLFDTRVSVESKLLYLQHVLKDQLGPAFYAFLEQLIKNNDINYYEFISKKFIDLLSQEKNCTYIEVVSAVKLQQPDLSAIREHLKKILDKEVFVHNTISKKIIGGFIINCGERMLDLSVQGALEQFKVQLAHV